MEADLSVISGGENNAILSGGRLSAIGGGGSNVIAASRAAIAGGSNNVIEAGADGSFLAAGFRNRILAGALAATILGNDNTNGSGGAFIAGINNRVGAGAIAATVLGGDNRIEDGAFGATIAGGGFNLIQSTARRAAIFGGDHNVVGAGADAAVILGGQNNLANGPYALAAGYRAKALHRGSLVWGDSTEADIASTGNNQFVVRATGGMRLMDTPLSFGNRTWQMLNLFGSTWGAGMQNSTLYFRSDANPGDGFAWYRGGVHDNAARSPGGGIPLMTLNESGLTLSVPLNLGVGAALNLGAGDLTAARLKIGTGHALSGIGSTIAGGQGNEISANYSTISGGTGNSIQDGAYSSTISGGDNNRIGANAFVSTVSGGAANTIAT